MDLKLYNPDAVCPKCGSGEIGKEYSKQYIEQEKEVFEECLKRKCKSCSFHWYEHCADYGTKEVEQTTSTSCSIQHTYVNKD